MSGTWDDMAEEWDKNHSVIEYSKLAFSSLQERVSISDKRVLDFGCGTGLLSNLLSPNAQEIVAIDPAHKMIDVLKSKKLANVSTIAEELSQDLINTNHLLHNGFDLIVASSALAFVPNFEKSLNDLKTLMRDGATIVQWDWCKKENETGSGFSEHEILEAYKSAGFDDVNISYPFEIKRGEEVMPVIMCMAKG